MCIICVKKRGIKMISDDTLRNCWLKNDDGAGFAFTRGKNVYIYKGFLEWKNFLDTFHKLTDKIDTTETPFIFHFRYATHGGIQRRLTHPFPMSQNREVLDKLNVKTHCAIAHNGIINGKAYDNGVDSDTYLYIQKVIAKQKMSDIARTKWLNKLSVNTGSKWAFLTKDGHIYTAGDFIEEDGVLYSNAGYLGWGDNKWYIDWLNQTSAGNRGWYTGEYATPYDDEYEYEYDYGTDVNDRYGERLLSEEVDWVHADNVLGSDLVNDILSMKFDVGTEAHLINLITQRIENKYLKDNTFGF
ncbi:MAG: hypothetical protein IJF90_03740 [Synergistaceae bacterium]|nr:hypothetical protein [Synergistaceae bacterium]